MNAAELRVWTERYTDAIAALAAAHSAIEALSDLTDDDDGDVDMKICFASNTLMGSAALLREADALARRLR